MHSEFILYLILFGVVPLLRPWKQINSVPGGQHQKSAGEEESLVRELQEPGEHRASGGSQRKDLDS